MHSGASDNLTERERSETASPQIAKAEPSGSAIPDAASRSLAPFAWGVGRVLFWYALWRGCGERPWFGASLLAPELCQQLSLLVPHITDLTADMVSAEICFLNVEDTAMTNGKTHGPKTKTKRPATSKAKPKGPAKDTKKK